MSGFLFFALLTYLTTKRLKRGGLRRRRIVGLEALCDICVWCCLGHVKMSCGWCGVVEGLVAVK